MHERQIATEAESRTHGCHARRIGPARPSRGAVATALLLALTVAGCGPRADRAGTGGGSGDSAHARSAATYASAEPMDYTPPSDSLIPHDELGASIRRGLALITHTTDSLPQFVGGTLRCSSCHLEAGRKRDAAGLLGVYSRFPKYMDRTGAVIPIEDRVNYCFTRSMAGSMARQERAASFIRHFMPQVNPGSLTDQQAFDLAAYVNSHARPDSPGKADDWPQGGAPADVPYDTKGHTAYLPPSGKLFTRPNPSASIVAPPASVLRGGSSAATPRPAGGR